VIRFDGYKNPEFKRLAMGRLFSDLHHHLSSKIEKPQEERLKLSINSCHDTSVGGILNALDVFDGRWPPFTSFVGIELFSSSPQNSSSPSPLSLSSDSSTKSTTSPSPSPPPLSHFVRVLYNGRTLSLPGCQAPQNHLEGSEGKFCTWEAFSEVLNKVKMSEVEWKEACGGGE
jgi:acid phosphatase